MQRFHKRMEDAENRSTYRSLSSDARKAHGLSASFFVYDEIAQAPNRNLYDNLSTSTGGRAEPLGLIISTQSADPHHVMSELVDYAEQVNNGTIEDPTFVGHVYAAPMDADPWNPETWKLANPALGVFRSLEEMETSAAQAQRIPARESAFRNLYLNQRVEADERFIAAADWDSCDAPADADLLRGRPCFGGLDLGSTSDLTSLQLYFPEDGGALLSFFWVPKDNLRARAEKDRVPYVEWAKDGLIETTPGRATDKRAVALKLAALAQIFDIKGIAFDRWGMAELERILAEEGITLPLKPHGQGFKDMGPSVDAFERLVLSAGLRHGGHPVLRWNVGNAVIETDPAGNRKPRKDKSRERIDGLVAAIMAVGLHAREPAAPDYSAWRLGVISA